MSKSFKISGTIFYAHVKEKNTKGKFPSNSYQLDLSIDQAHKTALTSLGVQVKNKGDDKGDFVSIKSKLFQPTVVLPDGTEVSGDAVPLIGNGSEATITVTPYDNRESNAKAGNGGKVMLGLGKIELNTLVEFSAPHLIDRE